MIIPRDEFGAQENGPSERRRHRRFCFAMPIELRAEGAAAPIRLQTTDISAGGCYVEMGFTLREGTQLEAVMWLGERKLVVKGVVVSSHPQFGNGVKFTEMTDDQRKALEAYLNCRAPDSF
jgi:c-di-GMP-binding flagellar brake protein YcgR